MKYPTKEQIIEWLFSCYTMNDANLPGICHCINVALAMEAIAEKAKVINPQDAKMIGLLHDIGKMDKRTNPKIKGEKHAHDLIGFDFLIEQGFPEIAYASLTHSLLSKNIDNKYIRAMFFHNETDIQKIHELLDNHIYTDIEKLLQVCDWIMQKDHICSLEESYRFIKNYYGDYDGLLDCLKEAEKMKTYFDHLCECDIYDICKKVLITNWDLNNLKNTIQSLI